MNDLKIKLEQIRDLANAALSELSPAPTEEAPPVAPPPAPTEPEVPPKPAEETLTASLAGAYAFDAPAGLVRADVKISFSKALSAQTRVNLRRSSDSDGKPEEKTFVFPAGSTGDTYPYAFKLTDMAAEELVFELLAGDGYAVSATEKELRYTLPQAIEQPGDVFQVHAFRDGLRHEGKALADAYGWNTEWRFCPEAAIRAGSAGMDSQTFSEAKLHSYLTSLWPDRNAAGYLLLDLEGGGDDGKGGTSVPVYNIFKNATQGKDFASDASWRTVKEAFVKSLRYVKDNWPNVKVGYYGFPFQVYFSGQRAFNFPTSWPNMWEKFDNFLEYADFLTPEVYAKFADEDGQRVLGSTPYYSATQIASMRKEGRLEEIRVAGHAGMINSMHETLKAAVAIKAHYDPVRAARGQAPIEVVPLVYDRVHPTTTGAFKRRLLQPETLAAYIVKGIASYRDVDHPEILVRIVLLWISQIGINQIAHTGGLPVYNSANTKNPEGKPWRALDRPANWSAMTKAEQDAIAGDLIEKFHNEVYGQHYVPAIQAALDAAGAKRAK